MMLANRILQSVLLTMAAIAVNSALAANAADYDSVSDIAFGQLTVEAARAYGNHNYEDAFHRFQRLACAGDKASQAMLGRMYLAGEGVPQDEWVGYVWLKVAAEYNFAAYRTAVKQIESALSPDQLKALSARAAQLREQYGLRATNMSCNEHSSGTFSSNVKDTVICTPKREGNVVLLHRCLNDPTTGTGEASASAQVAGPPVGTSDSH